MMKSKKAQGLGLVAVVIMLALLYFIFRYNTQAFEFTMKVGDERAHLVTSFTETEKAKTFTAFALRQAVYGGLKEKSVGMDCSNFECPDPLIVKGIFENYLSLYAPSAEGLEVSTPDYEVISPCDPVAKSIKAEAFGFEDGCFLKSTFLYPKIPCEDMEQQEDCESVKLTSGNGRACNWDARATLSLCADANPEPACSSAADSTACTAVSPQWCEWKTSYDEDIKVVSVSLLEYQFSVGSDAHIAETVSCADYGRFSGS